MVLNTKLEFVCSAAENEMPVFYKIVNIILKNEQAFLFTSKITTMYFDEHVNAVCIEEVDDVFTVMQLILNIDQGCESQI